MKYINTLLILQMLNIIAVFLSTRLDSIIYPGISITISVFTAIIIINFAVDKEEEK